MAVALPVVLIVAQGKASLLLHAENIGKLEEMAVGLMSTGLSHTDDTAAFIDELLYRTGNLRVAPPLASRVGRVRIPHVDQHVDFL